MSLYLCEEFCDSNFSLARKKLWSLLRNFDKQKGIVFVVVDIGASSMVPNIYAVAILRSSD